MRNHFLTLGLQGYKTALSLLPGLIVLVLSIPGQASPLSVVRSVQVTSRQVVSSTLSAPSNSRFDEERVNFQAFRP